ncbi:MAG: hypothetical protein RLZZ69_114, partial [Cyanobacteriota bacterium]
RRLLPWLEKIAVNYADEIIVIKLILCCLNLRDDSVEILQCND